MQRFQDIAAESELKLTVHILRMSDDSHAMAAFQWSALAENRKKEDCKYLFVVYILKEVFSLLQFD